MTQPTVLISGAGIAGPALAFWLTRSGYQVFVVETAPGIRPGGQTVDLRGAGGDVVERMGLLDHMRERSLDQKGIAWIRANGRRRAEMPVTAFNGNGLVSKLEILRGDLVDVLYNATKDNTHYRFNTRIENISQGDEAVEAVLTDGTCLKADLVVGADGPHSTLRRLAFGPEEQFVQPLGGYNAWFTAPDSVGLDGWYLMYQAPGLNASMRPSHDPALCKAGLAFRSAPISYDRRDLDEQRALLTEHFAGAGWQKRRATRSCSRGRRLLLRRIRAGAHAGTVERPSDAGRGRRILRLTAERHGDDAGARRRLCTGRRTRSGGVG